MTRIYSLAVVLGTLSDVATLALCLVNLIVSVFFGVWICDYTFLSSVGLQRHSEPFCFIFFSFFWLGYGSPSYLLIGNCGHFIEFSSPLSLSPLLLTHNLILLSKTLHTSPSTKTWLCGWTVSCIVQSLGQIVDVFGFISQVIGSALWLLIALLLRGELYAGALYMYYLT